MNSRVSDADLVGSTALTPLTRDQKLQIAAAALQNGGAIYRTVRRIEDMHIDDLKKIEVAGTVFEPMVKALNEHGVVTIATIGGVMQSLEIDRDHIHEIACACHENQDHMVGIHAAVCLSMIPLTEEKM